LEAMIWGTNGGRTAFSQAKLPKEPIAKPAKDGLFMGAFLNRHKA
jgi:hypothetical protein